MIASLTDDQAFCLLYDWSFWARPDQLPPPGDWTTWLLLGGRGAGKTRSGAEMIRAEIESGRAGHIALVGRDAGDVRDVIIEGPSGILATSPPWFRPEYEPSKKRVTWPNGARAGVFSAEDPDSLRGPEHDLCWCFIAGTLIATEDGERPVETIRVGDRVWTRKGLRTVLANAARIKRIGTVKFSHGRELTGTPEHPVLTSHGWTNLSDLEAGATICVASASNGAAIAGIDTAKSAISNFVARAALVMRIAIHSTAQFGATLMAGSQLGTTFITSMATLPITLSRTLPASATESTRASIWPMTRFRRAIGRIDNPSQSSAPRADRRSVERCSERLRFAGNANTFEPIKSGRRCDPAANAEISSPASEASFAASVVSIWADAGRAEVFNLQVEDAPEYFANGVLVHNCDELCAWQYVRETWDNLQFGLRIGRHPRQIITTTPRPIPVLKEIVADATGETPHTIISRASTYANKDNLAPAFLSSIIKRYENTRLGRQELEGHLLEDVAGALWTRDMLDKGRVINGELVKFRDAKFRDEFFTRIVVAVDPPASSTEGADECGIVVCGLGSDKQGYVLADFSKGQLSPQQWAQRAVDAYREFDADMLVAEANQGGEMVKTVIQAVDSTLRYKPVHAYRGKALRAEPVALKYEQGLVHHVGTFAQLEDQQCVMTLDYDAAKMGSPDRLDACVHALTELMLGRPEMVFG